MSQYKHVRVDRKQGKHKMCYEKSYKCSTKPIFLYRKMISLFVKEIEEMSWTNIVNKLNAGVGGVHMTSKTRLAF